MTGPFLNLYASVSGMDEGALFCLQTFILQASNLRRQPCVRPEFRVSLISRCASCFGVNSPRITLCTATGQGVITYYMQESLQI